VEMIYDYNSFNDIVKTLDSNFLAPITFSIPYLPKEASPYHYMSEDGYLYTKYMNNRIEPMEGPVFFYRINSNGFRSDHFEKLSSDNINILVAGCSYTFGEGIPEEYTWARLLENKIASLYSKPVKLYNLGFMGNSILNINSLVKSFINTYGKPDYLFLCIPDLTRNVIYDGVEKRYKNVYAAKRYLEDRKKYKYEYEYVKNFVYENNIYLGVNIIQSIETLCNISNIKLIWTAWHKPEIEIYKNLGFNNFFEIPSTINPIIDEHLYNAEEEIKQADLENINNIPYWKKARDMNHPGTRWSHKIADLFFESMINKYGI
jgi:hypothetical protein